MSETTPLPPQIAGITYEAFLGSGGFADVFLYRQRVPARLVAVKVIRPGVKAEQAQRFLDETDIMAQVSTHPCVVSLHGAGTAPDGRSYMVMEYCRPPHLGRLAREQQLSLDRVLRDSILVCGAVETIHRAGYLHRDIKPSNILINDVGRPALADFGLAVPIEAQVPDDDFGGASPPWAPYEQQVGQDPLTPASDVYALGATLYTMLTGRSPHEDPLPGASNTHRDMLYRAQFGIFPPVTRPDVPEQLRRVLRVALAAKPADRYPSALALARGLQEVQRGLGLPVTEVEVMEQAPDPAAEAADEDRTILRPVASIDPYRSVNDSAAPDATRFRPRVVTPLPPRDDAASRTVARPRRLGQAAPGAPAPGRGAVGDTTGTHYGPSLTAGARPHVAAPQPQAHVPGVAEGAVPAALEEAPQATASRSRTLIVALLAVVLVLAVGGVAAWSFLRDEGGTQARQSATTAAPDVVADSEDLRVSGGVEDLTLTVVQAPDGGSQVHLTWTYPDKEGKDVTFLYSVVDPAASQEKVEETSQMEADVDPLPGRTCVQVVARSANGSASQPATGCVETP